MNQQRELGGTVHKLPADLQEALLPSQLALDAWRDITPLTRNEWICWIESAKHLETRVRRLDRTVQGLAEGVRRPCCWIGCVHRTDKMISPSVKGVLNKQSRPKN